MFIEPTIAFLGLVLGFFLIKLTKEELGPGKRYFRILTFVVTFAIIFSFPFGTLVLIGIPIGLAINILLKQPYLYLGLLVMASSITGKLPFISSLTFIFGLSYSSWFHRIIDKKYILTSLIYFMIPFIFLLFPTILDYTLLVGIGMGGILASILRGFKSF